MTWNKSQNSLNTYTLNGKPIARAQFPLSGCVSCIEISVEGKSALIGMNPYQEDDGASNNNKNSSLKRPGAGDCNLESEDIGGKNRLDVPSPSICFLDLYTLQV